MKKYLIVFIPLLVITVFMVQCSKKGTAIIEPKFGFYSFSTFTLDTFRFKITLNGVVLTDSLLSPVGSFSRAVSFFDGDGRLQITDVKNNDQLVLDTAIKMQTGTSIFSIVQLLKGQKPYIPGPPANEAPPTTGNYKIRFQYLKPKSGFTPPTNINSVKCIIRNNSNGLIVDTTTLNIDGITGFYEVPSSANLRVRLLNTSSVPPNAQVFNQNFSITTPPPINLSGFNTVIMRAVSLQGAPFGPYLFEIRKAY